MNRTEFLRVFASPGPVITPVIHALDEAQTARNIDIAVEGGVAGVFLINLDFPGVQFLPNRPCDQEALPGPVDRAEFFGCDW